jgi:hypothetical protein
MFGHLAATVDAIELEGVHRFHHPWEAAASLRLRTGDPRVLDDYEHHGRIHSGTRGHMLDEVLDTWQHHRTSGESVVMLAGSNETVDELNQRAQHIRIAAGEIDTHRRAVGRDRVGLYPGDVVVTRQNHRDLRTDRGVMIRNRATWTVTAVTQRGIDVHSSDGTVTLPADYTRRSVELGYAQTIHGAQGRTVDHSLLLADTPLDGRGFYVALTRGRQSNHVYVSAEPSHDAREQLERAVAADWADRPALDIHADLHRPQPQPRHLDARLGRLQPLPADRLTAVWQERQQLARLDPDKHHTALRNAQHGLAVEQHRSRSLQQRLDRVQHELVTATGARAELPRLGHRRQRTDLDQRINQLHAQLPQLRAALASSLAAAPELETVIHQERSWLQDHNHIPGRIAELDRTLRLDAHARTQQAVGRDPTALDSLAPGVTELDFGLGLQLRTIAHTMAPNDIPTVTRSAAPRIEGPDLGISL